MAEQRFFQDNDTKPVVVSGVVINEYLSSYSKNRNIDEVFRKWVRAQDVSNPKKTIAEWDAMYQKFLSE